MGMAYAVPSFFILERNKEMETGNKEVKTTKRTNRTSRAKQSPELPEVTQGEKPVEHTENS